MVLAGRSIAQLAIVESVGYTVTASVKISEKDLPPIYYFAYPRNMGDNIADPAGFWSLSPDPTAHTDPLLQDDRVEPWFDV